MARDATGPKGEPQYQGAGVPQDAADLTEVAAYAANVGNRKAGTSAARLALTGTDVWAGLQFYETDTGVTWQYRADGTWYRGGGGHFEGQRTQSGVTNGQSTGLGAVTRDASYSSQDGFVTVGAGGTIAVEEGRYVVTAMMTIASVATGRSFVSIDDNDTGNPIARASFGNGEDRSASTAVLRALPGGRNIRINFVQTSGANRDVTIRVTIDRL